jgi:UDP-glucose 4-epimerase
MSLTAPAKPAPDDHVFVAGGAGYVGSHVAWLLCRLGFRVTVLDDLSTGHRDAVPGQASFIHCDLRDQSHVSQLFVEGKPSAVMNFAARSLVGDSYRNPMEYIRHNLAIMTNLAQSSAATRVSGFLLSSTAAIFNADSGEKIDEDRPIGPNNPYGESKVMCEGVLRWLEEACGVHTAALRYFNASGALFCADLGEAHDPETHLIPIVIQAALGRRDHVDIFGTDHPTPDGTCIRDYVHVLDLADAHVRALLSLRRSGRLRYNVGSGTGYSVKSIIEATETITGRRIATVMRPRRDGDPATLVACPDRIGRDLGWRPVNSTLPTIIRSALAWHAKHPHGFEPMPFLPRSDAVLLPA